MAGHIFMKILYSKRIILKACATKKIDDNETEGLTDKKKSSDLLITSNQFNPGILRQLI